MYGGDAEPGNSGRAQSSGEAERHLPPVRLSRADLGWRSLLFASPAEDDAAAEPPGSLTVESQGLTIHRREQGAVYVALDWGESGGGHGHPDRLNLLLSHGSSRWLDDLGTGSYVDESLHWYRSTLAHNAPLIDGSSQTRVNGECIGTDAAAGFDFIAARVHGLAPGVVVDRTVITGDGYFIDEVRWLATHDVRFELPIHFSAESDLPFTPRALDGGFGVEDGFVHVTGAESAPVPGRTPITLSVSGARAVVWSDHDCAFFRAIAPGQPASTPRTFHLVRCEGTGGVIRSVWTWSAAPIETDFSDRGVAVSVAGRSEVHKSGENQWTISMDGSADLRFERADLILDGDDADEPDDGVPQHLVAPRELHVHAPQSDWFSDLGPSEQDIWELFDLGEAHYRRSEESWREAGQPNARVAVTADGDGLVIDVLVQTEHPIFSPVDATNALDNEHPDINGHGVQLYVATDESSGGWVLVPETGTNAVRVRRLAAWGSFPDPTTTWRLVPGGFELRARLAINTTEPSMFGLDILVNDAAPGRARRRGQLVMSGADGEFVYLQGDRHDPARLVPFSID